MTALKQLLQLQALDKEALDIKKQCDNLQQECVRIEDLMTSLKKAFEEEKQAVQSYMVDYRHREQELQKLEDTLVKQKASQLSIKKHEELQRLEDANQLLKQNIDELELQLLQDLDVLDAKKQSLAKAEKDLAVRLLDNQKNLEEIQTKKSEALSLYENKMKEGQAFEKNCFGPLFETYKMLRQCKKVFPIVVPVVKENQCSGCHLRLSQDNLEQLKKETTTSCENCGRLIFFDLD